MNKVAIVGEFNPFHNGHKYLVEQAYELIDTPYIISTMSTSFVQRGEPAILDKWIRASHALDAGIDLIIELPSVFAVQGAEYFAKGAMSTLKAFNPEYLIFGAETPDVNLLNELSTRLINSEKLISSSIKGYLNEGMSFIKARNKCLLDFNILNKDEIDIISSPNNILALKYIQAIDYFNLDTKIIPISRIGSNYKDNYYTGSYSSATYIRDNINNPNAPIRNVVPHYTFENLKSISTNINEKLLLLIKYKLLSDNIIKDTLEYEEGLKNRILSMINQARDYNHLAELSSTNRITTSRIKRILINMLLNINASTVIKSIGTEYIRVLGSNSKGFSILKSVDKPYITRHNQLQLMDENIQVIAGIEEFATDIYSFLNDQSIGRDKTKNFIIK